MASDGIEPEDWIICLSAAKFRRLANYPGNAGVCSGDTVGILSIVRTERFISYLATGHRNDGFGHVASQVER